MNKNIELILGNSNSRFSGVTSTMLQVLPHQQALVPTAVLGQHHLPADTNTLSFTRMIKLCQEPLPDGRYRVFHARRNDEMIQALIAKLLGAKLRIAFTSTAQRHHSRFTRFLMRQMDGIVSTGSYAASFVTAASVDRIIPHGIDTQSYHPAANRAAAWQETGLPGKFGIGIFGRVRHSKGIDILVQASLPLLKRHPDATVVICGSCEDKDRSYQEQLEQAIAQQGLEGRYQFLGEQPFERIPKLFRAMTIVAALSRNEGFGLTPLEAMASGCAVLTSSAGAWPDIIDDGVVGYRVANDDVTATQQKLEAMLADPTATEKMGQAGREKVCQHYTVEQEARQLTEYLLGLTASFC